MRDYKTSALFEKNTKKLKGQELNNFLNKFDEILTIDDLDFYKNLKHDLKKFKRVHVNNSYVILFFGDDNIVHFVDYVSHDNAYKHDKKTLKKYDDLKF
jgi:mRNA-degrading endonuclease RelE of RelBE toxin-antitoxin system